jgi:hypothetical protein
MGKSYTGNITSTEEEGVIVIAVNIFNPGALNSIAKISLTDSLGKLRGTVLEKELRPKETIFLNTKMFIVDGDTLVLEGAEFIIAGEEV